MQGATFRCEVLLGLDRAPSWPRVGDLMVTAFPKAAAGARIEPMRGGHARIVLGKAGIECTWVGFP